MANYAVTDYTTEKQNTPAAATALLETYLETVDSTKTIYGLGVIAVGGEFVGWCIHAA